MDIEPNSPPVAHIDLWRMSDGSFYAIACKNHQEALAIVKGEPVNVGSHGNMPLDALNGLVELDALFGSSPDAR